MFVFQAGARHRPRGARLTPMCLALLTLSTPLWALADGSLVKGHVIVRSGGSTDSRVELRKLGGGVIAKVAPSSDGYYTFADVAPGSYIVHATSGESSAETSLVVAEGPVDAADIVIEAASQLRGVMVTAQRPPRNALQASTGSSQYAFDKQAIKDLPEGEDTSFNKVLLQAPDVTNDSYGQIHIRNDHNNLQYRINGIILPEGLSGFGQTLDTRFADKITVLTGALPAQYGDRAAGVIDVTTKQHFNEGEVSLYGGSHDLVEPSFQLGKTFQNGFSSYVTGTYTNSGVGIENPTNSYEPIHDRLQQGKGFGYFSYGLNDTTKVSAIIATSQARFELPNTAGLAVNPDYAAAEGIGNFDSAALDDRQFERSTYGILALQGALPRDGNYQVAVYDRVSIINYEPDVVGDLAFDGDASRIKRKSSIVGLQGDIAQPLGESHTLRAGFSGSTEDDRSDNTSTTFPVDENGTPTGGPETIVDNNPKNGNTLLSLYLQDQWDVIKNVTVNYGLRYDKLDAFVNAQQVSPRFGVVWYATPATTVHAAYARYFTPPPNELVSSNSIGKFQGTANGTEVTTNSPVQPQRDHYFDAGVVQQVTKDFNVGLDTFYRYSRQLIDEGQFGQAVIFVPFNYSQGRLWGVELSSAYHHGPWNAYLNISRGQEQADKVTSGEYNFSQEELNYIANNSVYTDHSQRISGSGGVSFRVRKDTTVGVDAIYQDGLRAGFANTDKLTPYTQVDLSATQTLHLGGFGELDLRAAVLNVLDRQYEIRDGSGIGVFAPQYGPRIGAYFGIAKPFRL